MFGGLDFFCFNRALVGLILADREIDAVQRELATLAADARATHEKLELRNKQFQLLLHSLADLQVKLK